MPVWWGIFTYMIIISAIGMAVYRSRLQSNIGIVDDSPYKDYKSIGLLFALLSFVLLAYFVGQRSWIFDSSDYQYSYENYYTGDLSQISDFWNTSGKGKLFVTILILFKHFSGNADYNSWFTFLAIVECASIAMLFYKYSSNFTFSIYLFFTSSCFLWLVNGLRQFLAVALVLFFVDWIKERKTIPFIIVVILVYFIHSSALLWIPVYFLINMEPWSKKFVSFSVIFSVLLLALSMSSILDDTEYSYLLTGDLVGVNPFRVVVMAVPSIIAFVRRKEISEKSTPFINILINLSVITSFCYIVGMFSNGIVGRIPIYFQMFNYLLLPWLLKNAFDEDTSKTITTCCIIGFMAYFCYDMYIAGNGIYQSANLHII